MNDNILTILIETALFIYIYGLFLILTLVSRSEKLFLAALLPITFPRIFCKCIAKLSLRPFLCYFDKHNYEKDTNHPIRHRCKHCGSVMFRYKNENIYWI